MTGTTAAGLDCKSNDSTDTLYTQISSDNTHTVSGLPYLHTQNMHKGPTNMHKGKQSLANNTLPLGTLQAGCTEHSRAVQGDEHQKWVCCTFHVLLLCWRVAINMYMQDRQADMQQHMHYTRNAAHASRTTQVVQSVNPTSNSQG